MKKLKRFTIKLGKFSIRIQNCEYETDIKPDKVVTLFGVRLESFSL